MEITRRAVVGAVLAGTVLAPESSATASNLEADAGAKPELLLCYNGELHYKHLVLGIPYPNERTEKRKCDPMRYQYNVASVVRISCGRYQVNFQYEMEQDYSSGDFGGYVALANANSGFATVTGWRYSNHCVIQTATNTGELVDCEFYLAVFGSRKKKHIDDSPWPQPIPEMELSPPKSINYIKSYHPRIGTVERYELNSKPIAQITGIGRIGLDESNFDVWQLDYNSRNERTRCMIARPLELDQNKKVGLIVAFYGSNGWCGSLLDPKHKDEIYYCWPLRLASIATMPVIVIDSNWGVHSKYPRNTPSRWPEQLFTDIAGVMVAEEFLPRVGVNLGNKYFVTGHSEGAARAIFLASLMHGDCALRGRVDHAYAIETEMDFEILRGDPFQRMGYPLEWTLNGWNYFKMLGSCTGLNLQVAFSTANYHGAKTEELFKNAIKQNPQLGFRFFEKRKDGTPMDHGTLVEAVLWEKQDHSNEGDLFKAFRKYCEDVGIEMRSGTKK